MQNMTQILAIWQRQTYDLAPNSDKITCTIRQVWQTITDWPL